MVKLVLFSNPSNNRNLEKILDEIFPNSISEKKLAYMPSGGIRKSKKKYVDEWIRWANQYGASFSMVDNASNNIEAEFQKLQDANILVISGGNTFELLRNLKKSGLDSAILEFCNRQRTIVAGYSAGAMILSPTIELVTHLDKTGKNRQDEDFRGLNIIDFEIFPHFLPEKRVLLEKYKNFTQNKVIPLSDNDYIVLHKE